MKRGKGSNIPFVLPININFKKGRGGGLPVKVTTDTVSDPESIDKINKIFIDTNTASYIWN